MGTLPRTHATTLYLHVSHLADDIEQLRALLHDLLRLIALLCVCGVILGIGSRCKSAAQTAAIGVLLFLLPSGLEYVFSLRFFPLSVLDVIQNLWEAPNVMLIESVILIIMGSVGYCVAVNNNKG